MRLLPAMLPFVIAVHAGAAIIALPYGSYIGGDAPNLVPPLAHDELLVGPFFSSGLDFRHWIGPPIGIEASIDLQIVSTHQNEPNGDRGLFGSSISVGAVVGW